MKLLTEFAEFLVASWRLANGDVRMPTRGGVLDYALQSSTDSLPDRFKGFLTFGNTRAGLRCDELADIMWQACAQLLVGPSDEAGVRVLVDEDAARRLLLRRDLEAAEAVRFGARLRGAIST